MQLDLNQIRLDGGTQPRAELLLEVIADYAEQMLGGAEFPPVAVFFDGKDYWLADGFHRLMAAKQAKPGQAIEVDVQQGTQSQAQWFSYSANKSHGLRRTNEDKQRAVKAALGHPQAAGLSNCEIAQHCGVDEGTIRKYRKQSTSEFPKSWNGSAVRKESQDLRTGRDGRTINTSKIGRGSRHKIHTPRSPAEFTEARRNGYRGHPSSMVKLELPNNHVHNCAFDLLERFAFEYLEKVFQRIVVLHQERTQQEKSP